MSACTNFILDSDFYQDHEVETLFQLSRPYSIPDIQYAKEKLARQLATDANLALGVEKQREILFFIDTIAQRLQNASVTQNASVMQTASMQTASMQNASMQTASMQTASMQTAQNALPSVIQQGTNFLIENPDRKAGAAALITQGRITTGSGQAPPGFMNPLNVRTIMQAISIDSRFRPNYYSTKSTNFDVVLPAMQKNVVSMRVASIELPTTYYAVSLANANSTLVIIDEANGSDAWLLTLPDGNYEQSWANNSQAAIIETSMVDAILAAQPGSVDANGVFTLNPAGTALTAQDLTFTVDRVSGKAVFGVPPLSVTSIFLVAGFRLRFNVDPFGTLQQAAQLQLRLGWQLGYRAPEYVAPQINGNYVQASEGICLVCGPRYGFISVEDYQKNTGPSYIVAYANSVLQDNIITRINLAELQADVGVYQSSSDPGLSNQLNRTREYFGPVDIQRMHIALFDEFGRVIDLNNMDWSLTLAFELLYN
jgi:hypothetical protein